MASSDYNPLCLYCGVTGHKTDNCRHIFTLLSILKNRKSQNKPTFLTFLDAEKAFDRVDRDLLMYKLLLNGIKGHMYDNIKSIYNESFCSININNMLTDWFDTKYGVKQGDTLSPTMFNIYINDIVPEVKSVNEGINFNGTNICILLYADDIVLLSENEEGLQKMLDKVYEWSKKWRIKFNANKSNVLHVRQSHVHRTDFSFTLGEVLLHKVEQYKYLGIVINEHVDYNVTAKILADAANRALGSIINKYKSINGLGYNTYTKLFNSGVCPIMDYGSEIWGYKMFPHIDAIQNKAIRVFLGVHRFAPLAAINGDMSWVSSFVRRKINMIRFWNRLMYMDETRLPKLVFNWDNKCKGNTWTSNISNILKEIGQHDMFESRSPVPITLLSAKLYEIQCNQWLEEIKRKPKL